MAKKDNNELINSNHAFLIYQDDNGIARVNVMFEGEDVWLTVEQIMDLFDASQQDVSYHINQIYATNEQDPERTHKKFLLVRQEGNRSVKRHINHYNLGYIKRTKVNKSRTHSNIILIGAITNGDYGNFKRAFCPKLLCSIEVEKHLFVEGVVYWGEVSLFLPASNHFVGVIFSNF